MRDRWAFHPFSGRSDTGRHVPKLKFDARFRCCAPAYDLSKSFAQALARRTAPSTGLARTERPWVDTGLFELEGAVARLGPRKPQTSADR